MKCYPSYSPPDYLEPFKSINPRPLRPLQQPDLPAQLPCLPTPRRKTSSSEPLPGYHLTTHIVPAAFPRAACNRQPSIPTNDGETRAERISRAERIASELYDARTRIQRGELHGEVQKTALFNVFNCFTRITDEADARAPRLTLVVLHANGWARTLPSNTP